MTFYSSRETAFSPDILRVDISHSMRSPLSPSKMKSNIGARPQHDDLAAHAQSSEQLLQDSSDGESLGRKITRPTIYGPKPRYPFISRRLREQGTVLIKMCIGSQGFVEKLDVVQSSGFQNLDNSAISTLAQWKFAAVLTPHSNKALDCYRMPVQFSLKG